MTSPCSSTRLLGKAAGTIYAGLAAWTLRRAADAR
jgi:hypothetical protein